MAKKIRFPLEMEQGIEVRSLEELKENFSLARVLVYLENGKLITWLRDRYADDIADAIEEVNKEDKDLARKICNIFDVPYNEQKEADLEEAAEHNRKLNLLKEYTDEQKYIDVVDQVAFSQDDLYDLLDEGKDTIYLCGEKFSIPLAKKGVSYIGINNPTAIINSKTVVDWKEKNIVLQNIVFNEAYQTLLSKSTDTVTKEESSEQVKQQFIIDLFKKVVEKYKKDFSDRWLYRDKKIEDVTYSLLGYDNECLIFSENVYGGQEYFDRNYYRYFISTNTKETINIVNSYYIVDCYYIYKDRLFGIAHVFGGFSIFPMKSVPLFVCDLNGKRYKELLNFEIENHSVLDKLNIENNKLILHYNYKSQKKMKEIYDLNLSDDWKKEENTGIFTI